MSNSYYNLSWLKLTNTHQKWFVMDNHMISSPPLNNTRRKQGPKQHKFCSPCLIYKATALKTCHRHIYIRNILCLTLNSSFFTKWHRHSSENSSVTSNKELSINFLINIETKTNNRTNKSIEYSIEVVVRETDSLVICVSVF